MLRFSSRRFSPVWAQKHRNKNNLPVAKGMETTTIRKVYFVFREQNVVVLGFFSSRCTPEPKLLCAFVRHWTWAAETEITCRTFRQLELFSASLTNEAFRVWAKEEVGDVLQPVCVCKAKSWATECRINVFQQHRLPDAGATSS